MITRIKYIKRIPSMLLSAIMVFIMIVAGLSGTAYAAPPQPPSEWDVTSETGVSGANVGAANSATDYIANAMHAASLKSSVTSIQDLVKTVKMERAIKTIYGNGI